MDNQPSVRASGMLQGLVVPYLLLGCAAILSALYFSDREANAQLVLPRWHFYQRLSMDWFRITEDELRSAVFSAQLTDMETLAVRNALARWRLRQMSPVPFENVMRWYRKGLWTVPQSEAWSKIFMGLDEQWIAAREATSSSIVRPKVNWEIKDGSLLLEFPESPPTSELGSRLVLLFDLEADDFGDEPDVLAYWQTAQIPQRSALHARRAGISWRLAGETGGKVEPVGHLIEAVLDLSWEPAWLAPSSRASRIEVLFPSLRKDCLRIVIFEDSPLLTPPGGNEKSFVLVFGTEKVVP